MRKILIIGIGAGSPAFLTLEAIDALRRTDVFFVTEKGADKEELAHLRRTICERHLPPKSYRTIDIEDPPRDRAAADYHSAVTTWHERRGAIYEELFLHQLGENECGAFLAWGDPSLYDSTLRIVEQIAARGRVRFNYEVIPGLSSIHVLAARHRIPLNLIGDSILITTGRRLLQQASLPASTVVVLLDGECAFKHIQDPLIDIYWAAYLGSEDEILLSGKLLAMAATIEQVRTEARQRKGWIMDTYLLRKQPAAHASRCP